MATFSAVHSVWCARRDILTFLRTGDQEVAYKLRRQLGLSPTGYISHPIPQGLFNCAAEPRTTPSATIIIPVFNAVDHVARLLARLPETVAPDQAVVVINDGSDDPGIERILKAFQTRMPNAKVQEHTENLGFVAAANTGLKQLPADHHAILLNSDTLPPDNWVPRLLAPIEKDRNVASVCPLSNSAEILSIPRPGIESELDSVLVDNLDRIARNLVSRHVELPTGIGFCLALNRHFIDKIGFFDPAFGRGYGEEVDWCLRAKAAGGRNVAATNLFVGHAGSASFGDDARQRGIDSATRKISKKYPSFAHDALAWESEDPIGPERLALALGWAATTSKAPTKIFIAHSLGGGAETALMQEMASHFRSCTEPFVILRAGGPLLWRVEVQGARFAVKGDVSELRLLHHLLGPLNRRKVIYSCAVGSADPANVPDTILELARGHELEIRLHDFFPISPSWNLIGSDERYLGVPDIDSSDPAHGVARRDGQPTLSHRMWREKWQSVIEAADEITTFAKSGAQLIEAAYPSVQGKVRLEPHAIRPVVKRVSAGGKTIGVLGGINLPKGGKVLENVARRTNRRIALIGELDGRFHLPSPHVVHGRYDQADISKLAAHYGVGLWLIPSICPETFSFATHEALATGLPVLAFDLGAQGEAVRKAPNGYALATSPEDTQAIISKIETLFENRPSR